jgi:hypothetical protein
METRDERDAPADEQQATYVKPQVERQQKLAEVTGQQLQSGIAG